MSTMSLKSLVEKLSPSAKLGLEAAVALCNSRSHFSVEVQHWLLAMCEQQTPELELIAAHFKVDLALFSQDLNTNLERAKTGSSDTPGLSPQLVSLLSSAWMSASIAFKDEFISPVHLIHALISDDSISSFTMTFLRQLEVIDPNELVSAWPQIEQGAAGTQSTSGAPLSTKAPNLDQFTVDLTEVARSGKLDPILGRDDEIRQMIDILTRRRQNNPIMTGDAGVGKTAVVEGLAQRIADSDVPDVLKNVRILSLDLALLQAGAGMKGEFENRLKSVIKEVKASPTPIIIFIDEAHTMIGSGGQAGQNDAANILKPALARGELRTIAATTWAEYKKYFEKDAALTRRFQVVKVEEPSEDQAIVMLRGLLPIMEKHHNVSISDQALQAAVRLSNRYINGRKLPDKAVALLDTACARVAMSQATTPGMVEKIQAKHDQLEAQIAQLGREERTGADHGELINELRAEQQAVAEELEQTEQSWQRERELVGQAKDFVSELLDSEEESDESRQQLVEIKSTMAQTKQPMVYLEVNEELVAAVISDWTGIPLGRMQSDEIDTILALPELMKKRVVGQDHALELIGKVVQTARAQLSDESKPNGVFLLTGPSGTGKTETALTLAEQVYGSEDNITVINMSEFKEEHKVSLLLGSPPGYVGYGEGGVLTEAVRRKPYSVVLLDEMEKAHPGVQDIFYQVFDKGMIKDGEGRDIDFKNTIVIMTSNVGTDTTTGLFEDEETAPDAEGLKEALNDDLLAVFKPAFLGRLNLIPFLPLSNDALNQIVRLQLGRVEKRFEKNYQTKLEFSESVVEHLNSQSQNPDIGARAILTNIQNILLPMISTSVLERLSESSVIKPITVGFKDDDYYIE